jgi:hypothetical protein
MTSLPHHSPTVRSSSLVIDWPPSADDGQDALSEHISSFVAWVETLPRQSAIHVRLPSVRQRASLRRLQRTLLTLGCTVTCRMQLSH